LAEKSAFFPLCVSLAFHFAFHPRFTETGRTMDASRFTFQTPIGVNVETLRGRLNAGKRVASAGLFADIREQL
jgi:hypothetical protein